MTNRKGQAQEHVSGNASFALWRAVQERDPETYRALAAMTHSQEDGRRARIRALWALRHDGRASELRTLIHALRTA